MGTEEKQTLELLQEMKKRWGNDLNPGLKSIKFSQTANEAVIELTFHNEQGVTITETTNLDFIADGEGEDDLMFKPDNDVVDNAQSFVALDGYSIINCIDKLLQKEAEERINKEHLENLHMQTNK